MKKPLYIIAAAMAFIVASSTAMAEPKKRSPDKATHRMTSPRSVPAPLRQWPPNNPTFRDIYAPLDGFLMNGGFKIKL